MVAGFAEKKEFVGCRGLIGTDEPRCQLIFAQMLRSPDELHVAIKISN
jgi:hypothetical protein